MDGHMAEYAIEMATVIAGSKENLRKRPPLSSLICTIARWRRTGMGWKQPWCWQEKASRLGSCRWPTPGRQARQRFWTAGYRRCGDRRRIGLAPDGLSGHASLPFDDAGIMNPRTGAYMGTPWEIDIAYAIGVELAHMWGVPTLARCSVRRTDTWLAIGGRSGLGTAPERIVRGRDRIRNGTTRIVHRIVSGGTSPCRRHLSPGAHHCRQSGFKPRRHGPGCDQRDRSARPVFASPPHA